MKRISSIAGVTVLPFIQAPKYTPGGMNEVRAVAWHFAQGGGTDTWLTRKDGAQGNNSCHIVVKYSGAIRQIVEFDDASWSLHINVDSETQDDAPDYGIFGLQHVKAALGGGWSDPNRYIVAIEVEGFYQDGPNPAQEKTIRLLARYLENHFPKAVHLGHRDFQDYKSCPGPSLFRDLLPHAGRLDTATEVDPMLPFRVLGPSNGTVTLQEGRGLVKLLNGEAFVPPIRSFATAARLGLHEPYGEGIGRQTGYLVGHESIPYIVLDDVVDNFVPAPVPTVDPDPALQAKLDAALAALNQIISIADQAA